MFNDDFVHDFENEVSLADDGADADLLATRRAISTQDCVRQRLGEGYRNVQRTFGG